jgi:hypothetical protein
MWLYTRSSFLSLVASEDDPDCLTVRARIRNDLERLWPQAIVLETPLRDYRYRTTLPREVVAAALRDEFCELTYRNFKQAARETDRRRAPFLAWIWRDTAQMGEKLDPPKRA